MADELFRCQADVFGDLTQQRWRNVSAFVEGNRCEPSGGVFELLVRAALTNQLESKSSEDLCHFRGLKDRRGSHDQAETQIC